MRTRRILTALVLFGMVGLPLFLPFLEAGRRPDAWQAWRDTERALLLGRNTILLIAGTWLRVLPVGTLLAFLLYRTDLPLARLWRSLLLLTLFVPLPLFASAWQAALGTGGWLPSAGWSTQPEFGEAAGEVRPLWKPWAQGLGAAVWVHAAAALPWVVLIVGQGMRWVERELEEDALTAARAWRVVWRVTLPRCAASLGVAALWVALMAGTEITVADMMQVRTLAEEVYLQFGLHDDAGLARTVLLTLPVLLLAGTLTIVAVGRWERRLPPPERHTDVPRVFSLRWLRWPCFVGVLLLVLMLAAMPVGSLLWKAGLGGRPEAWHARDFLFHVGNTLKTGSANVAASIAVAGAAGAVAALLALFVCWLAQEHRPFRNTILVLMAAAWVLPAPVVGVGLKEAIHHLLDLEETLFGVSWRPLRFLLYDGPSGGPIFWAYLIRFFPFAVAVQWPVVRHIPPELRDAIRVDGATPGQEFRHLILPLAWPACLRAGLAVTVLALGEIGASKLVWAGWHPFAHEVFAQMHYGVTPSLAALCLLLLGIVAVGGATVAWWRGRAPNT